MYNRSIIRKSVLLSGVITLFVFTCGGSLNFLTWKTQVDRLASPHTLIQPDKTAHFYEEMGEDVRCNPLKIFEYIQSQILYTSDLFNHAALNHLATAEEVLASKKDDCDGQAVLLCSVLRYAGHDAYTLIGPFHAWVEVETEEGTLPINYLGGDWFVKFNESHTEWRFKPLFLFIVEEFSLLTVVFSLSMYSYQKGFLTIIRAHVEEILGYFKYVFLISVGAVLIVVIILTFWIPGIVVASLGVLLVMEIIARIRERRSKTKIQ